jgi:hypothetical protein
MSRKKSALDNAILQQSTELEIEQLERALVRCKHRNKDLSRTKTALEKRLISLEADLELFQGIPAPKKVLTRIAKGRKRTGSREATALFVLSDWHCEETVTLEDTNGRNEYNLDICDQRWERWARGAVTLLEGWTTGKSAATVRDVVIALIGDMINGYLRDDDLIGNSLPPAIAVRWVEERVSRALQYLLDHYSGHIHVVCRSGNHGRMRSTSSNRIMWGQKESMSLEHLLYSFVAMRFESEPRITFDVPTDGIFTYLDIKGMTFRFFHGDSVSYGGGIGGLTIPLMKKLMRYDKVRRADMSVLGHFHQTLWHNDFMVNGSGVGYNSYANMLGCDPEQPQQSAALVRLNRGIDCKQEIWL